MRATSVFFFTALSRCPQLQNVAFVAPIDASRLRAVREHKALKRRKVWEADHIKRCKTFAPLICERAQVRALETLHRLRTQFLATATPNLPALRRRYSVQAIRAG